MTYSKIWECIDEYTERLKIPGGWVLRSRSIGYDSRTIHQVIINDPGHTWQLEESEGK
jgi:hypothetical protein